jgi:hypothetical protein
MPRSNGSLVIAIQRNQIKVFVRLPCCHLTLKNTLSEQMLHLFPNVIRSSKEIGASGALTSQDREYAMLSLLIVEN